MIPGVKEIIEGSYSCVKVTEIRVLVSKGEGWIQLLGAVVGSVSFSARTDVLPEEMP